MARSRRTTNHRLLRKSELPPDLRVYLKYADKCIAWSLDRKRVLASADTPEALHAALKGRPYIYEYIPPVPVRPVGSLE